MTSAPGMPSGCSSVSESSTWKFNGSAAASRAAPSCADSLSLSLGGADGDEERGGEHGQGDVAVPGVVAADLVLIQPDLVLRGLERLLDRPPGPGHPDQFGQPGTTPAET